MAKPWYTYPYDRNFGFYPDPVGLYPKPDANVDAPAGTPITALASGIVTGARAQPWGPLAYSITVKLDQPINPIATHMAYNYVESPQVSVGQHVDVGDVLATAGNPYGIATAFALSDADVYGTATKNEPFTGRYVNPLLSPLPFLDSIQQNAPGSSTNASGEATGTNPMSRLARTVLTEIGVPGVSLAALNDQSLTYVGAGITGAVLLLGAGVLFLFTGV